MLPSPLWNEASVNSSDAFLSAMVLKAWGYYLTYLVYSKVFRDFHTGKFFISLAQICNLLDWYGRVYDSEASGKSYVLIVTILQKDNYPAGPVRVSGMPKNIIEQLISDSVTRCQRNRNDIICWLRGCFKRVTFVTDGLWHGYTQYYYSPKTYSIKTG